MTETESESQLATERDRLQKTISDVEAARAASTPGTRPFFENALFGARSRLAAIEKKIKEIEVENERQTTQALAAVYSAQNESALNEREKETFNGFLKEEFFTKKDLDRLEKFYTHTWDRLSEHGKDQMSQRVWEGVRRDEYKFSELPKTVREKETDRAYSVLKKREFQPGLGIPENDRNDFIRAYESGQCDEAGKILDRDCFKKQMFLSERSKGVNQAAVEAQREGDAEKLVASASQRDDPTQSPSIRKSSIDVSNISTQGLKLADAPAKVSVADMPSAAVVKGDPSLGRG